MPETTVSSLMLFFEFCGQAHLGELFYPTTATGSIPIGNFAAGEIEEYGKNSLKSLIDEPDFEWLMIDASHVKVHPHAAGARGGNHDMARTKGGSTPRCT